MKVWIGSEKRKKGTTVHYEMVAPQLRVFVCFGGLKFGAKTAVKVSIDLGLGRRQISCYRDPVVQMLG